MPLYGWLKACGRRHAPRLGEVYIMLISNKGHQSLIATPVLSGCSCIDLSIIQLFEYLSKSYQELIKTKRGGGASSSANELGNSAVPIRVSALQHLSPWDHVARCAHCRAISQKTCFLLKCLFKDCRLRGTSFSKRIQLKY